MSQDTTETPEGIASEDHTSHSTAPEFDARKATNLVCDALERIVPLLQFRNETQRTAYLESLREARNV